MDGSVMDSVIPVNPFRCRMWELHDRLETHVNEDTCRAEIESFEKHGQLVPTLGRLVKTDPAFDVELIYGARRLFVAQHLNKNLLVQVRDMTDLEAVISMDIENRQRKNISPYEQGLCYAQWLRAKFFQSQDEIARTLRISSSQVSRYLKIARLPAVIVNAFESPLEIREGWGLDLFDAWSDPSRKATLVAKARGISAAASRPASTEVFRQLLASAARGRSVSRAAHDEVVKDRHGKPLFRIRQQRKTVALLLPIEQASASVLNDIKDALVKILQPVNADPIHVPRSAPSLSGAALHGPSLSGASLKGSSPNGASLHHGVSLSGASLKMPRSSSRLESIQL